MRPGALPGDVGSRSPPQAPPRGHTDAAAAMKDNEAVVKRVSLLRWTKMQKLIRGNGGFRVSLAWPLWKER